MHTILQGREPNSIKSDCVIGGFGFGAKDACLALRKHGFGGFYLFANDPLGRSQECSFYRGQLDHRHENSHGVPTLEMKFSFSKEAPRNKNENLPRVVSDFFKPPSKRKGERGGLRGLGNGKTDRDIAHTIVQVASVVSIRAKAIERVATLFASLRQHAICTANPYLQDAGEFVRRELGDPEGDPEGAVSSPTPPAASVCALPCLEVTISHGEEELLAVVTLQPPSASTIQICTWPDLLMCMLEKERRRESMPNRTAISCRLSAAMRSSLPAKQSARPRCLSAHRCGGRCAGRRVPQKCSRSCAGR
jgi:hypothetical protein